MEHVAFGAATKKVRALSCATSYVKAFRANSNLAHSHWVAHDVEFDVARVGARDQFDAVAKAAPTEATSALARSLVNKAVPAEAADSVSYLLKRTTERRVPVARLAQLGIGIGASNVQTRSVRL